MDKFESATIITKTLIEKQSIIKFFKPSQDTRDMTINEEANHNNAKIIANFINTIVEELKDVN